MKDLRNNVIEKLLKVNDKLTEMTLELLEQNREMKDDKWNANRLATIDNLRRANVETILKSTAYLTEKNDKVNINN